MTDGTGPREDVVRGLDDPGECLVDRSAYRDCLDLVPDAVIAAARETFTGRCPRFVLAELIYDSLLEPAQIVPRSAGVMPRALTFEAQHLGVALQLYVAAPQGVRRLCGQLRPGHSTVIEVRRPRATLAVLADRQGCFVVDGLVSGPLCLRWQPPDRALPIETEWVTV